VTRRQRNINARAALQCRSRCHLTVWAEWFDSHRQRRRALVRQRALVNVWLGRKSAAVFGAWRELVGSRMQGTCHKLMLYQAFVTRTILWQEGTAMHAVDDWLVLVEEEQNAREQVWQEAKQQQERSDEVEHLKKRHHSELADWRREFEAKLKDQKEKLKAAEDSLKPLQTWRRYSTCLAVSLVTIYVSPTIPAILAAAYSIVQQLDFPHWFVGMLIWVFLGGAVLRLIKWLSTSVLPAGQIKAAYRWVEEWGFDSVCLGLLIAVLCWPYSSAPPLAWARMMWALAPLHTRLEIEMFGAAGAPGCPKGDGTLLLPLLPLVEVCGRQVKYVCQLVVVVASYVSIQATKVLVAQAREEGLVTVIKTTAAKIVPSWFYSLHGLTVKELLEVVEDAAVPVGKRIKALNRLQAYGAVSSEQCDHICHWGGMASIIDILLAPNQNLELVQKAAQVLGTLCKSSSATDLLIRDRIRTNVEGAKSSNMASLPTGALGAGGNSSGGQVALGLFALVGLLDEKKYKARVVRNGLEALSNIADSCLKGADSVVTTPHAIERLVEMLSSRSPEIRADAARLVGLIAQSTFSARASRDSDGLRLDFLGGRGLRERRTALRDMVQPLVAELKYGWLVFRLACWCPGPKSCAARALGHLASGSAENVEVMVKAGAVQALMQILRLKNYGWLFPPTDNTTLLRLKGDAAFAVAAIAREGDLQRGRLQEAGAIQVLEQLWMGMMHNVDGEASAGMREEAQLALRAVRGGGESLGLRTPPISGSSTPFSSSRASSPGSSPRPSRRRGRDRD
jgi:hypothetical protein